MVSIGNCKSQSLSKYPYTIIDEHGVPVVIMTVRQAELINSKYKELEKALKELEEEHFIVKHLNEIQGDTIVNLRKRLLIPYRYEIFEGTDKQ